MISTRQTAKNLRKTLGLRTSENDIATLAYGIINPKTKAVIVGANAQGGVGGIETQGWKEDFAAYDTNDSVSVIGLTGLARATTTGLVHRMYTPGGLKYSLGNIGVQTTSPVMAAAGLDIRGVETNAIGTEIFSHFVGATGRPFIIGNDPAFYFKASITIADISGATVLIAGFRRAEANNITYTSYLDYGAIGTIASADPGAINIAQEINNAGTAPTDTTDTWADAATKVLEIRVSATGVVSYLVNGVAPTVVPAAQTFDDGDPVIPFLHFIQHTDIAGLITLNSWEVGFS